MYIEEYTEFTISNFGENMSTKRQPLVWSFSFFIIFIILALAVACKSTTDNSSSDDSSSDDTPSGDIPSGETTTTNYFYSASGYGIMAFSIGSGGSLTYINSYTLLSEKYGTTSGYAIANKGSCLYVTTGDDSIATFTIGSGGALTSVGSYIPTGSGPAALAISGSFLYVANRISGTVTAFSIGSDGSLSYVSGTLEASTYSTGGFDPKALKSNGSNLYVSNYNSGTVTAFLIGSDGSLSYVSGSLEASSYSTNHVPFTGTVTGPNDFAIKDGWLYIVNSASEDVLTFTIESSGALSKNGGYFTTGSDPRAIASSGNNIFIANYNDNTVTSCTIGWNKALYLVGTYTTGMNPTALAISGSCLYIQNHGSGTVMTYIIGPGGVLIPLGSYTVRSSGSLNGIVIVSMTK
jgi:6-phosphogluconolactonase (cycloisomerase 2 family)